MKGAMAMPGPGLAEEEEVAQGLQPTQQVEAFLSDGKRGPHKQ